MKVAIQGCCHGELDSIYKAIRQQSELVELLIICGDFQAIRNYNDLEQMSVPQRYKKLGNFYEYYNGTKVAPIPTIFIGGNHEASNYLWELFYGGWVAPNIYYLGTAGVVNYGGIRIGGISGIYNSKDYERGFFEKQPLTGDDIRSVYHVRKFSFYKANQLKNNVDVFLTHDWPRGIANYGNKEELLRQKGFLRNEISKNTLGSPPAEQLLLKIKPRYWFSAHMHVRFEATVRHKTAVEKSPNEKLDLDPGEIEINDSDSDYSLPKRKREDDPTGYPSTYFLTLDKCLPGRKFLEIIDIENNHSDSMLRLDLEWLAITRATAKYQSFAYKQQPLPSDDEMQKYKTINNRLIDKEFMWVIENFVDDSMLIPPYFQPTAPSYDPHNPIIGSEPQIYCNPQTAEFCSRLGIPNNINSNGISMTEESESLEDAKARLLALLGED